VTDLAPSDLTAFTKGRLLMRESADWFVILMATWLSQFDLLRMTRFGIARMLSR
jgi:hypothetical protein